MLKFVTILKVGLKAIARNKMRSTLTALGIIIGVACVIAMIAVGEGSKAAIQSQISSLGTNFLMIFPGVATQSGARIFTGQSTITEDDVAAVRAECPAVAYVTPVSRSAAQIVCGEPQLGNPGPGRGSRVAVRAVVERREGRVLQRLGGARVGQGLPARLDGRQRPLRGAGSGGPDGADQELPLPGRRRAGDQGRQPDGSGPGRRRDRSLHDGHAPAQEDRQDRHVHGFGGLARARWRRRRRRSRRCFASATGSSPARTRTS